MKNPTGRKLLTCALFNVITSLFLPTSVQAQETPSSPGRDAPAGVMNSMLHVEGEWMAGLRLMSTSLSGNRSDRDDVTEEEVFAGGYEHAPLRMSMVMPVLDIMYGLSDRVTLTGSLPFVFNSMDMLMTDGETFDMGARGIGDVRAAAMIGLWRSSGQDLHVYLGVQLPLGKVDARDDMPDCLDCKVDYPSQPGSGTFDLTPGLTWVRESGRWSWGANWLSVIRPGTNSEDYTFGDRHEFSAWGVRRLNDNVSASFRLAASRWGNVDGADPDLDPEMSPTQDPAAQGGRRADVAFGLGFKPIIGPLSPHRIAVEFGGPIVQSLDGPQLAAGWGASFSYQLWW